MIFLMAAVQGHLPFFYYLTLKQPHKQKNNSSP